MKNIVLVHGAWLGPWCWDKVSSELTSGGCQVKAVELPGHGSDQTPVKLISLASYVAAVERVVAASSEPVVLVGHSMAGVVISAVAERVPDKITCLVYVAAYLLREGESIQTASATDADSLVPRYLVLAPDYSEAAIRREGLREVFCADAVDADAAELEAAARAEPLAPFGTPVQVTAARFGRLRRRYVRTLQDRAVTPALQQRMLARLPCEQTFELDSSHSPFLSRPQELAAILASSP